MGFFLSARIKGCRRVSIMLLALMAASCHGRCFGQGDSHGSGLTTLVSGGKSDWKIVLRPRASMPEILAAKELARYIRLISQAELAIVDEAPSDQPAIWIESDSGALDGFDLVVASDRITIRGHTPRGALYGAYQLLEEMGCRWFYIGKLGEVVPEAADIALRCKKITQRASFRERSVMPAYPSYYERFDEWIDYLAKLRINNVANYYTDGLLDREMQPPQVETIPADARYFRSVGLPVHQNLMVCFRDWHSPPFSLVLSSRAAWNAGVNGWEVLKDYCRHYYGERLAGTMTGYYRKVEKACQLVFNGDPIVGPYIDMTWPPMDPVMRRAKTDDVLQAAKIHHEPRRLT